MSRFSLILTMTLLGFGCAEPQPEPEILRPVRSERATTTGGTRVRNFAGTARAGQETNLSFRVRGRIEGLFVDVGDVVRADQPIAQLEREDYEITVRQEEANLASARAAARNAEADLDRIRGLYENDNASKNDLDGSLAAAQSAEARVESSAQALQAARRQLGYTSLRAPVDGAIASVPVEVNENVTPGQTVVRMTSGSQPEVEVAIPELLIAEIDEGDRVDVTLDALPGTSFDAVVTEVGVASVGMATTFPVTVRLARESREVRSGMAANVAFRFEADHGEHIHLPSHAVGGDRDGRFVFVLEATDENGVGVVRRTEVEVGELTHDGLEILSGLTEGQEVVTAGVRRLTD
ncbi:MAG: efflux RND transporter periplasmic adaptor subunit, partial [Acidobacteriota bacterium]|nr:efflux RND transporter periplasmic adaptor subunit [Acidobacteriota bacterium]